MKKQFILFSIILLLAFVMAACGTTEVINNENNNEVNTSDNNEVNNSENDNEINDEVEPIEGLEEKIDISFMGINTYMPEFEDSLFGTLYLEEKFNVNLEFAKIPANDKPGIDLLVTSNSLPDCGWVYSGVTPALALKYFDAGATRSIPVDMVKEYAPLFYKILEENYDYNNLQLVPETDDEYYALYAFRYAYDTVGWSICVRYDWMENLNIGSKGDVASINNYVYATNEAYTVDEYTDLIYDFTFSDPDMNGENDTMGVALRGTEIDDFAFIAFLCSPYGLRNTYTSDENGVGYPTEFSPNAKKGYVTLANWINLKVINPDFKSATSARNKEYWLAGKVGTTYQMISWYDEDNAVPQGLYDIDNNLKVLVCPGLIDNDGTGGATTAYENFLHSQNAGFFFVRSDVDDEKLKRILMLYDAMDCDIETSTIINNGIEGVHFEYNNVGQEIELDQSEFAPEDRIVWSGFNTPSIGIMDSPANPDGIRMENKLYQYSIENWEPASITYLIVPDLRQLMELSWFDRENKKAKAAAQTEFLTNVFEGNQNIETQWDVLMGVLDNCGFEEYIIELNKIAYVAEEYKKGNLIHPSDLLDD